MQLVMGAWQSELPRLLIFDNCEEESLLDSWRPPSGGCRVLVTSRRSEWSPTLGVTALPLDLLPRHGAPARELAHPQSSIERQPGDQRCRWHQ